jgi:trk system potassium uptake protein TrkH
MEDRQVHSLSYAVRGRVIFKYFGQLCIVLSALTLVTLIASLLFREYTITLRYLIVALILLVTGWSLNRIRAPSSILTNEALVITALIFIFTSLAYAYPMMASGLSFEDALFESVSAVTTTGLSTLATVEDKPMTFLFSRAWMQWTGGLGIVVFSVAFLIGPGVAARRLGKIEEKEDIISGTYLYARRVLLVYVILTFLGILVLLLVGVKPFPALIHTFAAVSTGGFSSYNNSIAGMGGWTVQGAVMLISLGGSISLLLYYRSFREKWRLLSTDIEMHMLLLSALLIMFLLTVTLGLQKSTGWKELFAHSSILAFSAQTTTGFSTLDIAGLDHSSKLILILSMIVGGSVGSTAGGFKIFRLLILLRMLKLAVVKTCLPEHAVVEHRIAGQHLESDEIEKTLLVILMFIATIFLSWLPFAIMDYNPLNALFEIVSATGTVGLSSGITNHELPTLLKGVLCADMIMGRLEILAVLVLLYPGTWIGKRIETV